MPQLFTPLALGPLTLPNRIAIAPMGFCFPGYDALGGDLPPRRECRALWHDRLFALMPQIETVLRARGYDRFEGLEPAGDGAFYRSMAQAGARVDAAQARDMISLYRRNNGQGGVILDPTLQRVAEDQARAMAA